MITSLLTEFNKGVIFIFIGVARPVLEHQTGRKLLTVKRPEGTETMLTHKKGQDQHVVETIKDILRSMTEEELARFLIEIKYSFQEDVEAA